MLKALAAFSGLSAKDLAAEKDFYTNTLGLSLDKEEMGLQFSLPGGGKLFIYEKSDHTPAAFTVLNFVVENIDTAVDDLTSAGVSMAHYDNMPGGQDEKGIARGIKANMGPDIAWFNDPAGNILAVLQES